ncbi:M15 family metallopeptidase [Bacillus sp. J33]|uniref:M15 family metallopeptidase n=1 Tax=Bacillus sp. J33 TaxID=935836 RepID=UPI0004ACE276|nr:M15 family metallopeptidase [Bacillus sp. J33]
MTVQLKTLIDRSIRNMGSGVHPVVKESALEVIKRAYEEGIYVQISSGYRSFAEQNALYAQGRTKPGNVVTNAKGGQSNHNYGLAVDYFLVSDDGKRALWTVNAKWRRVAAIAKSLGFAWGGDWKGFVDYPHLEMMGGLSLRDLQNGKRPNLVSKVVKEEDEMLEEAVLVGAFPDIDDAELVCKRLQAPLFFRGGIPNKKVAKKLYVVGGTMNGLDKYADKLINLSGKDRAAVTKAVENFLK